MGMKGQGDVSGAPAVGHYRHRLGDHVRRPRPDNVDAKHPAGLGVGQDLDEAVGLVHALGPAVGNETELPGRVRNPLALKLFLALADGSRLRPGVTDTGEIVVLNLRRLAGQPLGEYHPLLHRLVGQHWALDEVADGVDARRRGLVVVVYLNYTMVSQLYPRLGKAKPVDKRPTADRHQHLVADDLVA